MKKVELGYLFIYYENRTIVHIKTNKNIGLKVRLQYTQLMNTKTSVRVRQN